MLHFYYHPILGMQWYGAESLPITKSKKRKNGPKNSAHNLR